MSLTFDQPGLHALIDPLEPAALDDLPFGVIGFDAGGDVLRYNAVEARATGLTPGHVLGRPLFTDIAQCMNNYLVAQRFEDAADGALALDATLDYVLTWRMKPVAVRMRLLFEPDFLLRYVVIERKA